MKLHIYRPVYRTMLITHIHRCLHSIRNLTFKCSSSMSSKVSGSKLEARYEATVTTGLEGIAREEIKQKLNVEATIKQGRIFFNTDVDIKSLLKLRTINNLFVVIFDEQLQDDQMPADSTCLEPLLMDVGKRCDWFIGMAKWKERFNFDTSMDVIMTKDSQLRDVQPKFRVSSNRHGPEHKFTSPEICTIFGHVVDTIYGWPIKMKGYDLEVYANFNEKHLYVCITLTPDCLDMRNIKVAGITTLKAVYCYSMLRLAKVETGDIVLDPMAGTGAIPVENAATWLDDEVYAYSLAGEINKTPLDKSKVNMDLTNDALRRPPGDVLRLDVTKMPFKDNSVDVLVSDLPFGRRHGSKKGNKVLYPALLRDMARVARLKTGRAVLLTQDTHAIRAAYAANRDFWHEKMYSAVKVGNLFCYFHLFHRNDTEYQPGTSLSDTDTTTDSNNKQNSNHDSGS